MSSGISRDYAPEHHRKCKNRIEETYDDPTHVSEKGFVEVDPSILIFQIILLGIEEENSGNDQHDKCSSEASSVCDQTLRIPHEDGNNNDWSLESHRPGDLLPKRSCCIGFNAKELEQVVSQGDN